MLPFGLKIAWFVLSVTGACVRALLDRPCVMYHRPPRLTNASPRFFSTGLLSSFLGLSSLPSGLHVSWFAITYGIANAVLQVTFCLGEGFPVIGIFASTLRPLTTLATRLRSRNDLEDGPVSYAPWVL